MSDTSAFLNALFGAHEGELFLDLAGEVIKSSDPGFISQNGDKLRVFPADAEQVFFLFGVQEESDRNAFQDCRAKPTVTLWRDGMALFLWAFVVPVPLGDPNVTALMEVFEMYNLEESIPFPGVEGWELIYADENTLYTPDALAHFYLEQMPEEPEPVADNAPMYGDAKLITPYNESDYDGRMITVSIGANQFSKGWKPQKLPLAGLIHQFSKHAIGPKDGLAVVLGDMVPGQRVKKSIKTCEAIGLDIDNGTPSAVVDKALAKLGCLAIRSTTHSHGKKTSEIQKDKLLKFSPETNEIDTVLVKRYLREKADWDESIIRSVEFIEEDQTEKGIVCRVSHVPMPKHRVIVPLSEPYVVANQGRTQQEAMAKWAKVPAALAAKLGVSFDKACTDLSRLFYTPRHAINKPYEISLFGGPLFELPSLELDNAFDAVAEAFAKGQSKSVTPEGRKLGRFWMKYAHGFQIMDVIEEYAPDNKRSKATHGYNICCPFDEDHSNAGDPTDGACFAVNAAEGGNEFFLVSCRHETCRDKTANDMLGKMLKDEWFEESVLEDPNFNIAEIEDAPNPKTSEKFAKEDKARAAWEEAIDSLSEGSSDEELNAVCRIVAEAKLAPGPQSNALKLMAKNRGFPLAGMKEHFNMILKIIKEEEAEPEKKLDPKGRRIFRYETGIPNFHDAADACVTSLRAENSKKSKIPHAPPDAYPRWCHMKGIPVEIVKNFDTEHLEFKEYTDDSFWSELCERTVFVKKADNSEGPMEMVPVKVGVHVFHQVSKHFPTAPEIIYTPLFARDGALISKPGYYRDNNILLPDDALSVGEINLEPTLSDVEKAVDWLRTELLSDFPFMDHDLDGNERRAPSEANAFAMLLTPFMRRMIQSCTPIFFISKPVPGTGGTLLGQLPMILFDGMTSAPARYSNNDEEMSKVLVSEIMQGRMCMFFDDVKEFNNREILRAATSKQVGGRILGGSRNIERDNNFLWVATGNNPVVLSEMDRRVVWIRLNAKIADIQKRTFRHDLYNFLLGETVPEVKEGHRATAVKHLLTMIQFWISTDMPLFTERKRASFEDWSAKVGGVLMLAGIEGFLDNRKDEGQDMDEASIKAYMREWLKKYGAETKILPAKAFLDADGMELDIIEGSNPDQKKHRFFRRLPTIVGRTFAIDSRDYMMCTGHDRDENVAYFLLDITEEHSRHAAE